MSGTWTISSYGNWEDWHDGNNPPSTNLLDLGVTEFKIKFCNRAADEARIQFERKEPILDPYDIWTEFGLGFTYLLSYDGTPVFSGRLEEVNPVGNAKSHKTEYVLKGGWHVLELSMYNEKNGNQWSTHCAVGQDFVDHEIQKIIGAAGSYSDSFIHVPRDNWGKYVSVSSGTKVPLYEFYDCTCAEVLNKVLSYFPSAFVWSAFDLQRNENVPILNAKYLDPTSNGAIFPYIQNIDHAESFNIRIPKTTRVPGVGVVLEGVLFPESSGFENKLGALLTTLSQQQCGFLKNSADLLAYANQLYLANWNGYMEGTLVLVNKDPPHILSLRPSKFLSLGLSFYNEPFSPTPIQYVEFDIGMGRTTVGFGPPSHLGPQDLVSLALANPARSSR